MGSDMFGNLCSAPMASDNACLLGRSLKWLEKRMGLMTDVELGCRYFVC